MKHVIIGNGIAGINAAEEIRRRNSQDEIVIISSESDHFFSRPALMYVHCGQLSERCIEPFERDHYARMNYTRVRDRVLSLDSAGKTLKMESGESIPYERLLIASGSKPFRVEYPGINLDGVGAFVSWDDMVWLKESAKNAKRAVIVGGGLIGIEALEIVCLAGVKTTFLIREDHFWPVAFSKEEGDMIVEHIKEHSCNVILETLTQEIVGENSKVVGLKTDKGETIPCDMLVFAIGVTPNNDFLKDSGLDLDERGGIVVDRYLKTNLPDIWAAGDCASVKWFNDIIRPEQLWYTSRDQGKVVGENMVGSVVAYERGTFYNSAKFFDIEYTTAGLINMRVAGEQNWFHRVPGRYISQRITYLPDQTVIGVNTLGSRWDHNVFVRWIDERRSLEFVLEHFNEANFDEEFFEEISVPTSVG